MARKLRSGYTTGACAAAAAKAAVLLLRGETVQRVEIPFPDGSRHRFAVHDAGTSEQDGGRTAWCSVIKDAGDDPDVTNGAEIRVAARFTGKVKGGKRCVAIPPGLLLCAGQGVGMVTKPGLPVPVGEPAINPVPRRMISQAVAEALGEERQPVEVTVSVVRGEELAEKTLNRRLGIMGGLSILGTTGIVRPVSAEAWTATIQSALDVAKAVGLDQVVLSTGRTSERAVQQQLHLPEEAYVMMGDYLAFSLREAARRGFGQVHLAGMWAKVLKAAMGIPQTHVRHGALEVAKALAFLQEKTADPALVQKLRSANTAREIYERLRALDRTDLVRQVVAMAGEYAQAVFGGPVTVYLVDGGGRVVERVP